MENKRGSFKGSLGFVLAAAGSAVGLGNIWRFPYLAAKDNGGFFILCYIILALTFGFALLILEQGQDIGMRLDEDVALQMMAPGQVAQAADNLDGHGFRRIEDARTAADIAGAELDLIEALAGLLAGNFHQIQRRHAQDAGLGAIQGRLAG